MSFLSKLFSGKGGCSLEPHKQSSSQKLRDIHLNYIGEEGECELKEMVNFGNYDGVKNKSLELYNKADDRYLESGLEADLECMYALMKNYNAAYLMWHYHDQIIPLFGDVPEGFEVVIAPTLPFNLPDSNKYKGERIPDAGIRIPLVEYWAELYSSMLPVEKHFAYDIIVCPRQIWH